jgi:hypothetical protein
VHPLGVVSLGEPRNHSSRFAANHAESWPSAVSQVAIQHGQGSDQPFPPSLSGGFQQRRVENEKGQHCVSVIDRRTHRGIVGQPEIASHPPDCNLSL